MARRSTVFQWQALHWRSQPEPSMYRHTWSPVPQRILTLFKNGFCEHELAVVTRSSRSERILYPNEIRAPLLQQLYATRLTAYDAEFPLPFIRSIAVIPVRLVRIVGCCPIRSERIGQFSVSRSRCWRSKGGLP